MSAASSLEWQVGVLCLVALGVLAASCCFDRAAADDGRGRRAHTARGGLARFFARAKVDPAGTLEARMALQAPATSSAAAEWEGLNDAAAEAARSRELEAESALLELEAAAALQQRAAERSRRSRQAQARSIRSGGTQAPQKAHKKKETPLWDDLD